MRYTLRERTSITKALHVPVLIKELRTGKKERKREALHTRKRTVLFNWLFQRVVQIYFDKEQREL
ncbi:MAG TPA: hypothetical protein DCX94_07445 [Alteromonas macleodii]|uniref:Uncharacterized protein n=2 Tax=Alteromonas TaxID=226 RepID=A0A0B3XXH6_9ALTE|nr:hypothetical protein AMBAS45_15025 [Alteromonas macleodii str. 'Balearic Sea AD45']AMJ99437.1 hypothetical protein AVL55_15500 [Alteromonas macleodii]KHT54321.1 hypothetical protein RJ41_07285 [Alteromonas marina]MCP4281236.1 hypothetical protein [Alteromonas sp.]NKX30938.1 hypothetical protein [Alteromonadaceae bacterium A_SAG1]PTT94331.1 hypothetical protein DBR45_51110 [Pseudomonas sp. HMWF031]